jgi:hypothetical protein
MDENDCMLHLHSCCQKTSCQLVQFENVRVQWLMIPFHNKLQSSCNSFQLLVHLHQRPENVKVWLICYTLQHFCLHFVTRVGQFYIFFFSPKLGLKNQKHCCKFAKCRERQKIIVGNQLEYSICLKHIPSLVTKCWCLCQSHKEVIESNVQVTFLITLHIY